MHQVADRQPFALTLDKRVRQRVTRPRARLVDAHWVDRHVWCAAVVDDGGGVVGVAEFGVDVVELHRLRDQSLVDRVALVRRPWVVLPQWPQLGPVLLR